MMQSEQAVAFATALAKAQSEVEGAKKDSKNPHFKSDYADLASVWDAIRKPFTSNGFSITQEPVDIEGKDVGLKTTLCHICGAAAVSQFGMKVKDPTNPQVIGSALTYMRRYALMAVTGIAPVDDDANAVAAKPPAAPGVTISKPASLPPRPATAQPVKKSIAPDGAQKV